MEMSRERKLILGFEAHRAKVKARDQQIEDWEAFLKRIEHLLEVTNMFANPKLYKDYLNKKDLKVKEAELPPEQVPKEFERLTQMGLDELEVEYIPEEKEEEEPLDPDMLAALTQSGFTDFMNAMEEFNTAVVSLEDVSLEDMN